MLEPGSAGTRVSWCSDPIVTTDRPGDEAWTVLLVGVVPDRSPPVAADVQVITASAAGDAQIAPSSAVLTTPPLTPEWVLTDTELSGLIANATTSPVCPERPIAATPVPVAGAVAPSIPVNEVAAPLLPDPASTLAIKPAMASE